MSQLPNKIFTYGTLMRPGTRSELIGRGLERVDPAQTSGVLLAHWTQNKRFPFLLTEPGQLDAAHKMYGVAPYNVLGQLVTVTEESLDEIVKSIDRYETTRSIRGKQRALYKRKIIQVETEQGIFDAVAWVAHPRQTQKLLKPGPNKFLIPNGWEKFVANEKREDALTSDQLVGETFGLETEFQFYFRDDKDGLHHVERVGGVYRVLDKRGKVAPLSTLSKLFHQALHSTTGTLGSDKEGRKNHRVIASGGMFYVDGELNSPSYGKKTVSVLKGLERFLSDEDKEKSAKRAVTSLPRYDQFFEAAGFPMKIERGSIPREVAMEALRRRIVIGALEDIVAVKHGKPRNTKISTKLEIHGNSTQYNVALDPLLEIRPGVFVDLSKKTKEFPDAQEDDEKIMSKFTYDVADTLARTFGPLVTYLLMGKNVDFFEYRVRKDNILEARGSYVASLGQLSAGIATLIAAVRTVEERIKGHVLSEARLNQSDHFLTEKDVLETYRKMKEGGNHFVHLFGSHVPEIHYDRTQFHPGIRLRRDTTYVGVVTKSLDEGIAVRKRDPASRLAKFYSDVVTVRELFDELFFYPAFNGNLDTIAEEDISDLVERFAHGKIPVESYSKKRDSIDLYDVDLEMEKFGVNAAGVHERENTFTEGMNHFLVKNGGIYSFRDSSHNLAIVVDRADNIRIDGVPVKVLLGATDKREGPVDQFRTTLHPGNWAQFYAGLAVLNKGNQPDYQKVWHVFYQWKPQNDEV